MRATDMRVSVLVVTLATTTVGAVQGISQARLAEWISTGSLGLKTAAVDQVRNIPPDKRERALEDALISELERLNRGVYERALLHRAGKEYEPEEAEGEYRLAVTDVVAQSNDPRIIPVLIGALGSGTAVSKALAKFGETAVEPLARVARADHPQRDAIADSIRALRYVVESGQPLSHQARDRILTVAVERLTGPQYFLYVSSAIDLAIATKDSALRRRVEQLAKDPQQIKQMGITSPLSEKMVRDTAIKALARKQGS